MIWLPVPFSEASGVDRCWRGVIRPAKQAQSGSFDAFSSYYMTDADCALECCLMVLMIELGIMLFYFSHVNSSVVPVESGRFL